MNAIDFGPFWERGKLLPGAAFLFLRVVYLPSHFHRNNRKRMLTLTTKSVIFIIEAKKDTGDGDRPRKEGLQNDKAGKVEKGGSGRILRGYVW